MLGSGEVAEAKLAWNPLVRVMPETADEPEIREETSGLSKQP